MAAPPRVPSSVAFLSLSFSLSSPSPLPRRDSLIKKETIFQFSIRFAVSRLPTPPSPSPPPPPSNCTSWVDARVGGGEGRGWLFDHSRFDALPRTLVDRCCDLMDHLSGNYLQVDGEKPSRTIGGEKGCWEIREM